MIHHPACVLDFETFSEKTLGKQKSVGAERYALDPSTEVLCLSYHLPQGRIRRWVPGDPIPSDLIDAPSHGLLYYAANAPFDRAIWKHILSVRYDWPYPGDEAFIDIAVMQCYYGLPRSVEEAAKALRLDIGKDLEGAKLMKSLCKPMRITKNLKDPMRHHTPESLERLGQYCDQDVKTERLILAGMPALPRYTYNAWRASERMNERGIKIDRPFVHNAIHLLEVHRNKLRAELSKTTGGQVTKETEGDALGALIQEAGILTYKTETGKVATDKHSITDYIVEAEASGNDRLLRVLELRQELNKSSTGKYVAMDRCAIPGTDRLHGMWTFYGAHTGRWTGSLVQLQNPPKGDEFSSEAFDIARSLVLKANYEELVWMFEDRFMTLMGALVRAALIPEPGHIFHVSDYSAVEGRGLAWLADEQHILQAYIDGKDLYRLNAATTYRIRYEEVDGGAKKGPQRTEGKVGELAGGYGGGVGAFKDMAKNAVGIILTDERARELRDLWRANRPKTVALWRNTQDAAMQAIRNPGLVVSVKDTGAPLRFKMDGRHLKMALPSGRILYYRNAYIGRKIAPWDENQELDAIFYWGVHPKTKQWARLDTYGGKLVENAVQALCADLLYEAIPRLEAAGYRPVGTVHDEVISEDPIDAANIERFNAIMSEQPEWAAGFPIAAAGFTSPYYRKD